MDSEQRNTNTVNRILILIAMVLGAIIGVMSASHFYTQKEYASLNEKIGNVLTLVQDNYVDTVDIDSVGDRMIAAILSELDPHCTYLSARDAERTEELMRGNFEGVGIVLHREGDTTFIGQILDDGPSSASGLLPGDFIWAVDGVQVTGMPADSVVARLRGPSRSKVDVTVKRKLSTKTVTIRRGLVLHKTVVYSDMIDRTTGYILLSSFSSTSYEEFHNALRLLLYKGMKNLILDLRGNGGGSLESAVGIANEFLPKGSLIVYTQGAHQSREDIIARAGGLFTEGKLTVLVDESSASASEVVSGALQDNDRATIIGRRTFGKGLVQREFHLQDGSSVLLTVARYYTPSGRCIQRPYDNGTDEYNRELQNRYKHGELFSADSIHFPDSLKYTTFGGRTVYGGGGIMPDIFVPIDTTPSTPFYRECRRKGILNQFPQYWADQHRTDTLVADFDRYMANYDSLTVDSDFVAYAATKGVVLDSILDSLYADDTLGRNAYSFATHEHFLHLQIKALLSDNLFGRGHYYRIMKEEDPVYRVAVETLRKHRGKN